MAAPPLSQWMHQAKNFAFLGEAGCGKSELAVNLALRLTGEGAPVHLFDLDMTKPLFRSRDQRRDLEASGIHFHFEEQFMDAPTLGGGVSRLLRAPGCRVVLDVGGDSTGARSIGGYAPLLNRPDTAVCYVVNPFRPWSGNLSHIDKILGEILGASHVSLERLRLAANPNFGRTTTVDDVIRGFEQLQAQIAPYKPLEFCAVWEPLAQQAERRLTSPVFPLRLYLNYPWEGDQSSSE